MSLTFEETKHPIALIDNMQEGGESKVVSIDTDAESDAEPGIDYANSRLSADEIMDLAMSLDKGMTLNQKIAEMRQVEADAGISMCKEMSFGGSDKVSVMPSLTSERIFMCGPSGMGKSTQAREYADHWKLLYPEGNIIIFALKEEDPAFDGLEYEEVVVDDDILERTIELSDLKNFLVIIDDCDNLQNKDVKKFMFKLVNDIFANGRKEGIYAIFCGHLIMKGHETKLINSEANKVFYFTGSGDYQNVKYLNLHCNMSLPEARRLAGIKSRWICINRSMPRYIVSEKLVMLL